jgi:hypothetical protein
MTLGPLASTTDLSARGVTTGALAVALDVASSAIRDAAGATISSVTSTVSVNANRGNLLQLPGPITAVAAVAIDGCTLSATEYEILPNGLWRKCGWGTAPVPVVVTYTHGLATVPNDIVDLTCQFAIAWLRHTASGGGSSAGLSSVKIDDAAEAYTEEAAGQVSPVYIPEVTRRWLAARFGGGVQVVETL